MIILTPQQADYVRGNTANSARLEPIAINGGNFVLPEVVLNDRNHEVHWEYLSALPRREVKDEEWIRSDTE